MVLRNAVLNRDFGGGAGNAKLSNLSMRQTVCENRVIFNGQ